MPLLTNNIGWCDDTGNMVIGCTKVSPGCAHCYAANDKPARVLRSGKWPGYPTPTETWGPGGTRVPVKALAEKARRLNKSCICDQCRTTRAFHYLADTGNCGCGGTLRRIRLFADSNSDWLDDRWPAETLARLLKLMRSCPNIDFQLLTKRPENFRARLELAKEHYDGWCEIDSWLTGRGIWRNVWLGVSVEDQKRANQRIPELLKIPAAVRFLSCEPLLEAVDLDTIPNFYSLAEGQHWLNSLGGYAWEADGSGYCDTCPITEKINWVIVGGESDQPKAPARPCNVDWVRSLVRQCQDAKVPVYVKQLGDHCLDDRADSADTVAMDECWPEVRTEGRRILLRTPAGADPTEWPEDLRVRQFPNFKP